MILNNFINLNYQFYFVKKKYIIVYETLEIFWTFWIHETWIQLIEYFGGNKNPIKSKIWTAAKLVLSNNYDSSSGYFDSLICIFWNNTLYFSNIILAFITVAVVVSIAVSLIKISIQISSSAQILFIKNSRDNTPWKKWKSILRTSFSC